MAKIPLIPPRHRAYPRASPEPVRSGAAPPPKPASAWTRDVPKGRRFPRG